MAQAFKTYKNCPEHDGRIRISKANYPIVRAVYRREQSQARTAQILGISKSSVGYIVNPASRKRLAERRKGRPQPYDREKNTESHKKWRQKKRELHLTTTRK